MSNYINIEEELPVRCIRPFVKYIEFCDNDIVTDGSFNVMHISKCARVCYGKEDRDTNIDQDIKTFQSLVHNKHLSMLRHDSFYYVINVAAYHPENMMRIINVFFDNNPFVSYKFTDRDILLISANGQFIYEKGKEIDRLMNYYGFPPLGVFRVKFKEFKSYSDSEDLVRHTIIVNSNIGVTRELNRVSPNNIAESSTRYIVQSKSGWVGTVCLNKEVRTSIYPNDPIWFEYKKANIVSKDCLLLLSPDNPNVATIGEAHEYYDALMGYRDSFVAYKKLIDKRVSLDIARNNLPLVTAAKAVYTYTLAEWKHIIDIRYHGTTGRPHPDAKEVAGMIRDLFIDMNIDIDKR